MRTNPTDRELVAAHLGGDPAALGAIYDRYGASLYDTGAAMLRDRDEAADAVQETFLVASQKLGQLRDPDRLKPWLFAVLRNDVFRRTKRRGRTLPTDFSSPEAAEMGAPTDPLADATLVERDELAALVRSAAAGLDERDQLVMELSLRQDLAGDDLAAAVGVTTKQAHVLVHRMRDRLLRSLGALTVARMGRDDCDELAALLIDWDGTFSVLVRKRVARHIDRCEICDETRSRLPAGALFAAAPVLAAPPDLRDAVLAAASTDVAPTAAPRFDVDGFPVADRRARPRLAVVAAVIVLLALFGLGAGLRIASRDAGEVRAEATSTTVQATTSSSDTGPSSTGASEAGSSTTSPTTTQPSTTAPSAATSGSTTSAPIPGSIVVSTTLIDLGATAPSRDLVITNPGQETVTWMLRASTDGPFVWDTTSGRLAGGAAETITVSIERSALDEGAHATSVTLAGGASSTPVQVRARVERAPQITDVRHSTSVACRPSGADLVQAKVVDESAVTSVILEWSGPGGDGSASMLDLGAGEYEGSLDPDRVDGNWRLRIVATDARGNTTTISRPFVITGCRGGGGGGGGGGFTS